MVKLLARLQSEGFTVANDWEITDTHTWTPLEGDADSELLVQREAEKTVRAERASVYRERIARMVTAFEDTQNHYTEQVHSLIPTLLDG